MKHDDCKNYIHLDCEKGMCALDKALVPLDGEAAEACGRFVAAEKCGGCAHFSSPDRHGIGACAGLGKPNWAYATMSAFTCTAFKA